MHTSSFLSTLLAAGTALAAPTSPVFRRQQDCGYYPDQANQATSTFILRIEAVSGGNTTAASNATLTSTNATLTNTTSTLTNSTNSTNSPLGYLDALSTSHALLAPSKKFASKAFLAPTWNTNRVLLFWPASNPDAQEYERGFNLDPAALTTPETIAPVISTPGCGTPFVELVDDRVDAESEDVGECEFAGKKIRAQTGCPPFGTANGGSQHCSEQKFFVCEESGLQGIGEEQGALFYGAADAAQYGGNCKEVELVAECA